MSDPPSGLAAVITTIQAPTDCTRRLASAVSRFGGRVVVVGDRKGPDRYDLPDDVPAAEFLHFDEQAKLPFTLAGLLPAGHYARKNLGYLAAVAGGAMTIYETDDDNAPAESWTPRKRFVEAVPAAADSWVNAYRLFTGELIWPRGFPLARLRDPQTIPTADGPAELIDAPIQQGLADGSPDVDAVWRMVLDREFHFERRPSVQLRPGAWCPFNSQSTWWWPDAYPLLYLPSHCSFRMTDIWRSFVAQRCLWELGTGVVFHAAEVVQLRNEHSLQRDFEGEVPGYLHNEAVVAALAATPLEPGTQFIAENLRRCYRRLVDDGFLPPAEIELVDAWVHDLAAHGSAP
jgi:hypothetical protein